MQALLVRVEYKAVRSILNVMNAVDVFAEMSSSMQAYLLEMFTEKELREILNDLVLLWSSGELLWIRQSWLRR